MARRSAVRRVESPFSSMFSTRMGRAPRTAKYRARNLARSMETCAPRPISRPRTGKFRRYPEKPGPNQVVDPRASPLRPAGCRITSSSGKVNYPVLVYVRDNDVNAAIRVLKKKMQREGTFREMKRRRSYEKPSERRVRERAEAVRRYRKATRKTARARRLLIERIGKAAAGRVSKMGACGRSRKLPGKGAS